MWDLTVFTPSNSGSWLACDSHVYLHNAVVLNGNHDEKRAALDIDLLLILILGGPPNHWRITGTPSLGEVPSGGARAFCLLLRCSKVSRRKGQPFQGLGLKLFICLSCLEHPIC